MQVWLGLVTTKADAPGDDFIGELAMRCLPVALYPRSHTQDRHTLVGTAAVSSQGGLYER